MTIGNLERRAGIEQTPEARAAFWKPQKNSYYIITHPLWHSEGNKYAMRKLPRLHR